MSATPPAARSRATSGRHGTTGVAKAMLISAVPFRGRLLPATDGLTVQIPPVAVFRGFHGQSRADARATDGNLSRAAIF